MVDERVGGHERRVGRGEGHNSEHRTRAGGNAVGVVGRPGEHQAGHSDRGREDAEPRAAGRDEQKQEDGVAIRSAAVQVRIARRPAPHRRTSTAAPQAGSGPAP